MSQHAADALGDVVYAQLPEPGTSLEVGEECGAVESVKVRVETSHWSRSIQILCSDWLRLCQ